MWQKRGVVYGLLPLFLIEGNSKFQLEVCENKALTSAIQTHDSPEFCPHTRAEEGQSTAPWALWRF